MITIESYFIKLQIYETPIPKLPVEGPNIVCLPGRIVWSTHPSIKVEYAGPTLCDPDG